MKCRPQFEPWRFPVALDLVADVNGILQVRHRDPFLDHEIADTINPDRHPVLEPEFAQILGAFQIQLPASALLRA